MLNSINHASKPLFFGTFRVLASKDKENNFDKTHLQTAYDTFSKWEGLTISNIETRDNAEKTGFDVTVNPAEAELLVFSSERSIIKLALRATGDHPLLALQAAALAYVQAGAVAARHQALAPIRQHSRW